MIKWFLVAWLIILTALMVTPAEAKMQHYLFGSCNTYGPLFQCNFVYRGVW